MKHMETESQAIERLKTEGYGVDLRIDERGRIADDGGSRWDPGDVIVAHVLRFEGMSSPDDEAMLLALEAPEGVRGTLVLPYGPEMLPEQIEASRKLLIAGRPRSSVPAEGDTDST